MPQATPAGKACGPCAAAKAACSLTGRAIGSSQSQVDPESFRRILDEVVGTLGAKGNIPSGYIVS